MSPHTIEHLLAGKHATWGFKETLQNGKLFWPELDKRSLHPHFMLGEIHVDKSRHQDLGGNCLHVPSAKERADPRHNLAGRLLRCDVIDARLEVLQLFQLRTASIRRPK